MKRCKDRKKIIEKSVAVIEVFAKFARLIVLMKLKQNHNTFNMKKFLFFAVAVLLVGRMTAQTIDTIDLNTQNEVPTVILLDSDFDESSTSVNDASTLLNSSRDVFNSIAAYNFGSLRYRVRGNDSKYSEVMINGISMNDPETGRPVFSNWGGLNDAFRNSMLVEGHPNWRRQDAPSQGHSLRCR